MSFDINNEYEKATRLEFDIIQEQGKAVQDILNEFIELLIPKVRIPVTNKGATLLKRLIREKVIKNIDINQQLMLSNYEITITDVALLLGAFTIQPGNTYEMLLNLYPLEKVDVLDFEIKYGCEVREELY